MATAPSPTTRTRRQARLAPPAPRWRRWLLLGLFFGLGHGLTQRLMEVRWQENSNRPPAFRAKSPSGGTSLEELRRRQGDQTKPLAADLDTLAREKRDQQQKQEAAKREEAARLNAAQQEEKERLDSERRRLEEFNRPPEPAASAPDRQQDSLPVTPPTPELPPPEPFGGEQAPPPMTQPSGEAPPSQP